MSSRSATKDDAFKMAAERKVDTVRPRPDLCRSARRATSSLVRGGAMSFRPATMDKVLEDDTGAQTGRAQDEFARFARAYRPAPIRLDELRHLETGEPSSEKLAHLGHWSIVNI